jgi:hypothetical protein
MNDAALELGTSPHLSGQEQDLVLLSRNKGISYLLGNICSDVSEVAIELPKGEEANCQNRLRGRFPPLFPCKGNIVAR